MICAAAMRRAFIASFWGGMLCTPATVIAHHSFAMYDSQKTLAIDGVIQQFQWSNPHVLVWLLTAPVEGSEPVLWTIELPTSPAVLSRLGWDKHSLNVGDRVVMEFNPLRSGLHGGSFKKATVAGTGKVLTAGAGTPVAAPAGQH